MILEMALFAVLQAPPAPPAEAPAVKAPDPAPAPPDAFWGPSTNPYVDPWGCEAEHPQDVSPTGKYWGKYQFDFQTWVAHGGDPDAYGRAGEAEQDRIAARVTYDAWPNC
jgi:hypothetical protein